MTSLMTAEISQSIVNIIRLSFDVNSLTLNQCNALFSIINVQRHLKSRLSRNHNFQRRKKNTLRKNKRQMANSNYRILFFAICFQQVHTLLRKKNDRG